MRLCSELYLKNQCCNRFFFFVGKWYVVKYVTCLSYNFIGQDCELMKHFAGPTPTQFEVLYDFFNDIDLLKKTNE